MITEQMSKFTVPEKPFYFDSWRKHQKYAVERIVNSPKRFIFLEASTGIGKSNIGLSAAKIIGGNFYYLVMTKDLQYQILRDFPFMAELKGRNNFKCAVDRKYTCDICPYKSTGMRCPIENMCPYLVHKRNAIETGKIVINYPMFLTNQVFVGDLPRVNFLICDEGHTVDAEITKFVELKFTKTLFTRLGVRFPTTEGMCIPALEELRKIVDFRLSHLKNKIYVDLASGDSLVDSTTAKDIQMYENILKKLEFFNSVYDENNWVCDYHSDVYSNDSDYFSFKPITPAKFTHYIFGWADKILFMSATFPPIRVICRSLNIPREDIEYIRLPSIFDRVKRPVFYTPVGSMAHRYIKETLPLALDWISNFLKTHNTHKILVHCVNYKIVSAILSAINSGVIENTENMNVYYHMSSEDRQDAINSFRDDTNPCLLLSPSVETGLDLPYDMCRYQIIVKVPYLNLGDIQTRTRAKLDRLWYLSMAAMRIVQACGRIVRAEDDWGVTYILDSCFADLIRRHKDLFPEWFLDAICVPKREEGDNNE